MRQGTRLKPTKHGYVSVPQQISAEILRHLSVSDESVTSSRELARRLGYSQNYIKQIASEMVKSKIIASTSRGYLAITHSQK